MTVQAILDAMAANPTSETINKYLEQALKNAVPIAVRNAPHYTTVEACVLSAVTQFRVLKAAINDDEKKLALFRVDVCPVAAFKKICREDYRKLEEMFRDKTD